MIAPIRRARGGTADAADSKPAAFGHPGSNPGGRTTYGFTLGTTDRTEHCGRQGARMAQSRVAGRADSDGDGATRGRRAAEAGWRVLPLAAWPAARRRVGHFELTWRGRIIGIAPHC